MLVYQDAILVSSVEIFQSLIHLVTSIARRCLLIPWRRGSGASAPEKHQWGYLWVPNVYIYIYLMYIYIYIYMNIYDHLCKNAY